MITIDFTPVRNGLFDWINKSVNGLTIASGQQGDIIVKGAEQSSVRSSDSQGSPKGFIEYKFLTGLLAVGLKDELRFDQAQDKFFLYGVREFAVQVDAVGEKSVECIAQVQQGLSSPIICDVLRAAGLSVIDDNTVADATLFLETEHEPRAVLDVRFGMALQNFDIVEGLDIIESVGIENAIYSTQLDVTINKP